MKTIKFKGFNNFMTIDEGYDRYLNVDDTIDIPEVYSHDDENVDTNFISYRVRFENQVKYYQKQKLMGISFTALGLLMTQVDSFYPEFNIIVPFVLISIGTFVFFTRKKILLEEED